MKVRIKFEPRDCWIGLFYDSEYVIEFMTYKRIKHYRIYICLIPCFPVVITYNKFL